MDVVILVFTLVAIAGIMQVFVSARASWIQLVAVIAICLMATVAIAACYR